MCRMSKAAAAAVLALLPGVAAAQSVNMGHTFHALEARATRVTTTFPDVIVDVRRGGDRRIEAVVRSRRGDVRGRLHVGADGRRARWQGARPGRGPVDFDLPNQATVSLDWAAHQVHALQDDEANDEGETNDIAGANGAWDGHVRRSRRALARAGRSAGQLAARVERVETEFPGLVIRAELDRHARPEKSARRTHASKWTATIVDPQTGAKKGFVRWFESAQVLTWKIEGGSQGVIMPDRLPEGWTFTPTMAWANVQAFQFATQQARSLEPADPLAMMMRGVFDRPTIGAPLAQLARAVAPMPALTLMGAADVAARATDVPLLDRLLPRSWGYLRGALMNEPGCDNLHWLDGTVFRACCDRHDLCYEANGCNSNSWWWPFAGSWSCQRCNVTVVHCFCTLSNPYYCGGGADGGNGGGGAGGPGGGCTSVAGGFCPVDCMNCLAH